MPLKQAVLKRKEPEIEISDVEEEQTGSTQECQEEEECGGSPVEDSGPEEYLEEEERPTLEKLRNTLVEALKDTSELLSLDPEFQQCLTKCTSSLSTMILLLSRTMAQQARTLEPTVGTPSMRQMQQGHRTPTTMSMLTLPGEPSTKTTKSPHQKLISFATTRAAQSTGPSPLSRSNLLVPILHSTLTKPEPRTTSDKDKSQQEPVAKSRKA